MKKYWLALLSPLLAAAALAAEAGRTDLARELYVESSKPDITLTATTENGAVNNLLNYRIKAPTEGAHTLLCFIDGKFWVRQPIKLPGQYKLNTGGLAPGSHKITLQIVDKDGRLGVVRFTLEK